MISTQALTLLQLALVLVGGLCLWRWPRHARAIAVGTIVACFIATGLTDTANWRAYVDPFVLMAALALVFWIWRQVIAARRQ